MISPNCPLPMNTAVNRGPSESNSLKSTAAPAIGRWISIAVGERYCELPRPVATGLSREPITLAEHKVLAYVRAGYSNKEIAALLGKAEPTVKHQVSSCLRKFGVSSRMRLMAALS